MISDGQYISSPFDIAEFLQFEEPTSSAKEIN